MYIRRKQAAGRITAFTGPTSESHSARGTAGAHRRQAVIIRSIVETIARDDATGGVWFGLAWIPARGRAMRRGRGVHASGN